MSNHTFKKLDTDQMSREFTHWHSINHSSREVDCPLCYKEFNFKSVLPHLKNNCCPAILRYSPENRYEIIKLYSATNPRNRPKVNSHLPTSEEEIGGEITNVLAYKFEGIRLLYKVELRFIQVEWMENALLKKSTEGRKWIQRVSRWRKRDEMKESNEVVEPREVVRANQSCLKRVPKKIEQQLEEDIEELHIQIALNKDEEDEEPLRKQKKKAQKITWKLIKSKLIKDKYWGDLISEIDLEVNQNNSRVLSSTVVNIITFLFKDSKVKTFSKLLDRWPTPGKFFQSLDVNKKFFLSLGKKKRRGGVKMASTVTSNISSILKLIKMVKINENNFIRLKEMKGVKKFYLNQRKKSQKSARDLKKHCMRSSVMKAEGKLCSEESFKAISEFSTEIMGEVIKSKVRIEEKKNKKRMMVKRSK
jgi:hypothetical protein